MGNRDIVAASEYHESTKLSYINLGNKPPLYKSYGGGTIIRLPTSFAQPAVSTLAAVAGSTPRDRSGSGTLDLTELARLLFYSAGLVKKRELPVAGEVHYRAAASAGALYPIEVYFVAADIPGLAAGVYHFSPSDFTIRQLREGDYRGELVQATAGDEAVAAAPVTMIFSALFWRSAWKYRERGYRYCFWDAGTILANLLATARGEAGLRAKLVAGFIDHRVDYLLGIQGEREASICLVALGAGIGAPVGPVPPDAAPVAIQSNDNFQGEISYPVIAETHASSRLTNENEVQAWRGSGQRPAVNEDQAQLPAATHPRGIHEVHDSALGETILRRGSTRRFARVPISIANFEDILHASTQELPADFAGDGADSPLVDTYIIANAVDGMRAGAYYYSTIDQRLELLKPGDFRQEAGHLCFEQALGADSAAVVFFTAELDRALERYGNRGYRAAQLESGILVGNVYLCAHSLGLGATGMTFYDDEVIEFFSPHAERKSLMFLVAVGATDANNRVRPFRSRVGVRLDALARGAGGAPGSQDG